MGEYTVNFITNGRTNRKEAFRLEPGAEESGTSGKRVFTDCIADLERQTGNNCLSEFGKGLQPQDDIAREWCGLWNNLDPYRTNITAA